MANSTILSAERELELRKPIDDYVGKIQAQIDQLRADGTDKVVNLTNDLDNLKRDRIYTAEEKAEREKRITAELEKAKAVEAKNKDQVSKLIADAEAYLKAHYDSEYYQHVVASCKLEKVAAQQKYQEAVAKLETAALEVMKTIKTIAQQKEKLDEADKAARQQLADAMAKYGVKSFENSILKVTYIPASTKTTIDSKKLKAEKPAIYQQYSKTSMVKDSVRITVK